MKSCFSGLVVIAFLSAISAAQAPAASPLPDSEYILMYNSVIRIKPNATLGVRESIAVHALGQQIRHGIYRDFPTEYRDGQGNRYRVHFQMVSASRDGKPEPFRVEAHGNGVRIYLGNASSVLPPGIHDYIITYTVDRELGFFADHDELYWNVTGTEWGFPIERATAEVMPPAGVPRDQVRSEGYTGPAGSRERALTSAVTPEGYVFFRATRPLAPHEGLTIVVMWPKGYVSPPSTQQKLGWFLSDNAPALAALVGLVLVLAYQFVAWWLVGRDPKPGTIVPLYEAPSGLSPAAMRFLHKMGYDNKVFASLLVSLAVKGYLKIAQDDAGQYRLTRISRAPTQNLSDDEASTARALLSTDSELELMQANHERIHSAIVSLKRMLAAKEEKIYFLRNRGWLAPSVVLSALTLIAIIASADASMLPVALFMSFWLSIWTVAVAVLSLRVVNLWRGAMHGRGWQRLQFGGAIFLTLFALPFFAGEMFGLALFAKAVSVVGLALLAALVASNFIFHELLKAPTHLGRDLLDKVAGFKMFLAATTDPERGGITVSHDVTTFEKYLPYAIALDVEKAWAAKFAQALSAAATATGGTTSAYPSSLAGLYAGGGVAGLGSISNFASSLGSAVASASTAPGSSSGGGGGGSSGGGGGGGGGGGW